MPQHLAAYTLDRASVLLINHGDLQGSQHPLDIFRYLAKFLKAPDVYAVNFTGREAGIFLGKSNPSSLVITELCPALTTSSCL